MFLLEYDGERMLLAVEVDNDTTMNSKQLAGMMARNPKIAKMVAGALPWYTHLIDDTDEEHAEAAMQQAIDEYDVYLEKVGGDY